MAPSLVAARFDEAHPIRVAHRMGREFELGYQDLVLSPLVVPAILVIVRTGHDAGLRKPHVARPDRGVMVLIAFATHFRQRQVGGQADRQHRFCMLTFVVGDEPCQAWTLHQLAARYPA
jgi:hypothetical protein